MTQTYWLEHAWLDPAVEPGVSVEVAQGRIAAVRTGVGTPPPGAEILRGLTLPGLANAHSHAFHRALRGTVQVGSGTFWTCPGSRRSASSTMCTTPRAAPRTPTRTPWARR